MATWTYVGEPGVKHHIGLFHGKRTGHVVIHLNGRIVVIDFKVLDTKVYSFFIEDELCEIHLKHKGNYQFVYTFHINKQVDTPRNRYRKDLEKKYWWQSILFFSGIVGMAVLVALLGSYFFDQRQADYEKLFEKGEMIVTEGMIQYLEEPPVYQCFYVANGQPRQIKLDLPDEYPLVLNTGLPLQDGDQFQVAYPKNRPTQAVVLFDEPTELQLVRYKAQVASFHLSLHPDLHPRQAACLVEVAFAIDSLPALAYFLNQDTPPTENPDYNREAYLRLTRDLPFQQAVEEQCW